MVNVILMKMDTEIVATTAVLFQTQTKLILTLMELEMHVNLQ